MAYITKAKKDEIAELLRAVVPPGWRYTLALQDHSALVMTIQSAPVDLLRAFKKTEFYDPQVATHLRLDRHRDGDRMTDKASQEIMAAIFKTLNTGNHDRSDPMRDYFDVGHYVVVNIGRDDRPFICTMPPEISNDKTAESDHNDSDSMPQPGM